MFEPFIDEWSYHKSLVSKEFKLAISKYLIFTPSTQKFSDIETVAKFDKTTNKINVSYNKDKPDWNTIDKGVCKESVYLTASIKPELFFKTFKPLLVQFFKVLLLHLDVKGNNLKTAPNDIVDLMIKYETGKIDLETFTASIRPLYGKFETGRFEWDLLIGETDALYPSLYYTIRILTKETAISIPDDIMYKPSSVISTLHLSVPDGKMKSLNSAMTKLLK